MINNYKSEDNTVFLKNNRDKLQPIVINKKEIQPDEILKYFGFNIKDNSQPEYLKQIKDNTTTFQKIKEEKPIIYLESFFKKMNQYKSLQKWEGTVIEKKEDTFIAKLNDMTNIGVQEEAEIYIEEISNDDRELIKSGNKFYWHIGYFENATTGQRTRDSFFRFIRLPKWNKLEIKLSEVEADRIKNELKWGIDE